MREDRIGAESGDMRAVSNIGGDSPRLVLRGTAGRDTVVTVRGERIGDGFTLIAGPCAVESRDQVMRAAEVVAGCGVRFFRAGAYKPRTSPYSFQGLREEGLRLLSDVRAQHDLRIVTEVMDAETLPAVREVADVLQVGSRNMHNYSLLEVVGRAGRPVLLKRGMSATIVEWLLAAEYLLAAGNPNVILCERGIRTFEPMTRNTLDLAGAVVTRRHTHLPLIVDPSHGVGIGWAVPALARAAAAAGMSGVMVEMHPHPDEALSDGEQALTPEQFRELVADLRSIARLSHASP